MAEYKASRTVRPVMARPMASLRQAMGKKRPPVRLSVVHRASSRTPPTHALAPGIEALTVEDFVEQLADGKRKAPPKARGVR